jgi:hypothetical protein
VAFPVYSRFLAGANAVPAGVALPLGGPTEGFVWVIRHVACYNALARYVGLHGVQIVDAGANIIFAVGNADAVGNRWYGRTMHQTIEFGDGMTATSSDSGWILRISGFQLTGSTS